MFQFVSLLGCLLAKYLTNYGMDLDETLRRCSQDA